MGHQNVRGSPKIENKYLFASVNTVKRKHVLETVTFSITHSHVLHFVKKWVLRCGQREEMYLSEWWLKDKMKF